MDGLEVSTEVYASPEEVYDFLLDFPGYANYSSYLQEVRQVGDGTLGTEYHISVSWWKFTYGTRAEVTAVEEPERIEWRLVEDLDARGHWAIEDVSEQAPPERNHACRVSLVIEFDPDSAHDGLLDLPRFVSLEWVVDRVTPLVGDEAERVVERVVADLEGQRRPVDLTVRRTPSSI